ncbi:MAG: hypothetical protein ACJ8CR_20335 [Roseiflexaceae bacterium]
MRLRTHLLASALVGIALYPRAPRRALLLTLAGVAVDLDHYLLYALRSGDWSLAGALRYDRRRGRPIRPGDTRPRYGSLRSIAHRAPISLPLAWLLARRWPVLRPLAAGLTLHLALDAPLLGLDWRVWRRARGHCERCGVGGLRMGIYYVRTPDRGGARWALDNRAAWCDTCAREARRGG